MKGTPIFEIWIKDASTRDSNIALRKAVEAIADADADFRVRVMENGIEYIVDASPGCVRLPAADAERVVNFLLSTGHDVGRRDMSLLSAPSSASRSAARRDYLAGPEK